MDSEPGTSATSDDVETDSSTTSSMRSLVDAMRSTSPSDLSRKRKVLSNPPTGVKRHTMQTKGKNGPISISVHDRLKEFTDKPFTVSCGSLFCSACCEPLSLKKSVIHVDSSKHKS